MKNIAALMKDIVLLVQIQLLKFPFNNLPPNILPLLYFNRCSMCHSNCPLSITSRHQFVKIRHCPELIKLRRRIQSRVLGQHHCYLHQLLFSEQLLAKLKYLGSSWWLMLLCAWSTGSKVIKGDLEAKRTLE